MFKAAGEIGTRIFDAAIDFFVPKKPGDLWPNSIMPKTLQKLLFPFFRFSAISALTAIVLTSAVLLILKIHG